MQNKNILVTGGAGFIGSHLVEALAKEKPAGIVVVDNLFLGKEDNLTTARELFPGLKFFRESAADYKVMGDICRREQVEVIFDLAVIPLPKSLEAPKFTVDENVMIVSTLCELARQGFYQTLVHFSSSEIYGTAQAPAMAEDHPTRPLTPYAASKLAGCHVVLSYRATFGLDATIVLPFNNYGPRQNEKAYAGIIPKVIGECLAGKQVTIFGDGRQTRDFIFVKDTVQAAIACYKNPDTRGKVINLGSGKATAILDLVRQLVILAGGDPEKILFGPERPGDVRRHLADVSLAKKLIGFTPEVNLEEGLKITFAWYREHWQETSV